MKQRYVLLLIFVGLLPYFPAFSQNVNDMKAERARIEQQIAESKKMLATTEQDVKGQMRTLGTLTEQIRQQQALIGSLDAELRAVDADMKTCEERQQQLAADLAQRRQSYAKALTMASHRNTFERRLTFLFTAKSYSQMYRRARYLREYSNFQIRMGKEIQTKQEELAAKQNELIELRAEKQTLRIRQQQERDALAAQQSQQQALVKKLQKQQADIKHEINRQQSQYDRLNKEIDRLIAEQIAASQRKRNTVKKEGTADQGTPTFKMSAEDVKLSGTFAANKGKFPVPVLGPYMLVAHYGINKVEGMKDVKVNNQGVDIRCGAGATIRSIYEGEVSAIFVIPTRQTYGVLVRHGEYISVYCNLATLNIKQGDKVKLNTVLGTAGKDASGEPIIQFQLRKNQQRLNPEEWIRF